MNKVHHFKAQTQINKNKNEHPMDQRQCKCKTLVNAVKGGKKKDL